MSKTVYVRGHSDDCIEVEGDLNEEFSAYEAVKYLHFNEGTVLKVEYAPEDDNDYNWRIGVVRLGEGTTAERFPGTYDGEDGMKCDKYELSGNLSSVKCYGSAKGATGDDIELFFDRLDYRELSKDQQIRIMAIANE